MDEVFDLFRRLAERCGQAAGSTSGGEQQMAAEGSGSELLNGQGVRHSYLGM